MFLAQGESGGINESDRKKAHQEVTLRLVDGFQGSFEDLLLFLETSQSISSIFFRSKDDFPAVRAFREVVQKEQRGAASQESPLGTEKSSNHPIILIQKHN